jgi:hypothetical protein
MTFDLERKPAPAVVALVAVAGVRGQSHSYSPLSAGMISSP